LRETFKGNQKNPAGGGCTIDRVDRELDTKDNTREGDRPETPNERNRGPYRRAAELQKKSGGRYPNFFQGKKQVTTGGGWVMRPKIMKESFREHTHFPDIKRGKKNKRKGGSERGERKDSRAVPKRMITGNPNNIYRRRGGVKKRGCVKERTGTRSPDRARPQKLVPRKTCFLRGGRSKG